MEKSTHKSTTPAQLLVEHSSLFKTETPLKVLDLACGSGRNGLYLTSFGHQLTFIDKDISSLKQNLSEGEPHTCYQWDLETENSPQLPSNSFDIVLVFNYLYRPILEQIKASLKPGGILIYETFITQQATIGRPRNPSFLLKSDELTQLCHGWEIDYSFEGKITEKGHDSYKAQIIAIKPSS